MTSMADNFNHHAKESACHANDARAAERCNALWHHQISLFADAEGRVFGI
jgi:hypothetical protein